jgi:hypothetical protein
MAKLETVKDSIRSIAGRRKNVTASEIEKVCGQLGLLGYTVSIRGSGHRLFTVNGESFSICTHNRGSKQINACYVTDFLKAMIRLELYEQS